VHATEVIVPIAAHSQLAEGLLPWVFLLVVVVAVLLWWNWRERTTATATPLAPKWVALALAVTAVVATTGTAVQAIRVGHSGAAAVWSEDMGTPAAAPEKD